MLQVTQNYQLVKVLVTGDVVSNPPDGGQSYQSDCNSRITGIIEQKHV